MGYNIDDAYLEILASAMAHDLLSPVGAVASGVEFLGEMGGADPDGEALSLIAASGAAASAKLQLLRAAWGGFGADAGFTPADAHARLDAVLEAEGGRVVQNWDPVAIAPVWQGDGAGKALLLALMTTAEALPRGGVVTARPTDGGILVEGAGERAALREHIAAALALQTAPRDLPPDAAHAAVAGLLLRRHGFRLSPRAHMEGRATLLLARAK